MDAAQPFFVWLVNYYGLDFYINYSLERVSFEFFYYMNYWKDRPVFESELCQSTTV